MPPPSGGRLGGGHRTDRRPPVCSPPSASPLLPPPAGGLSVTHNFCFRASWGMLRTSFLSDISKSNPCPQESGMRHVATATNWAVSELADAERGDERRPKRLGELAKVLGQPPPAALPEACGDGGMLKCASHFFAHDAIAAQDLLQSHGESTYRRFFPPPPGLGPPAGPGRL